MSHHCSQCGPGQVADCNTCKLALLDLDKRKAGKHPAVTPDSDDEYSICEQLTKKGNDFSILYLVIAALLVFALVIAFTLLLK